MGASSGTDPNLSPPPGAGGDGYGGYSGYWTPGRGARLALEWKWSILGCVALYLPVINLLQSFMKNRQPMKLRYYSILWNLMLAVLSLFGAVQMLMDDWTIVTHVKYDESMFQPRTRMVVAVFCLTKVIEFGDTVILALKKRPILFLHVYHHLTVAVYCWHAQYLRVNFAHSFVFMNLVVHGAMYMYYALTGLFQKNWFLSKVRPYITLSQITQMLFGVVLSSIAMYSPDITPNRGTWWNAQMSMIMYVSYCFLFTSFYVENFHKELRPAMASFLGMFHIFAIVGIVKMCNHPQAGRLFLEVLGLYVLGGFGITCGAHRLWSHRAYKANLPFRTFLMICNSIANQGNIFRWSRDHRCHHRHSDTGKDPHNATRGFFYSHMGWLLLKKPVEVKIAGKEVDCSDLVADPVVRFQMICDPYWNQFFSFGLPAIYGHYAYGDYWLGFFVLGAFRWLVCLHATWTINSVAHLWGARPYNPNIWPRENWFASLVANGEGWHNWHHEYPFDYATSEGGVFEQWNPSKLVIDIAAVFGMVWDRKRATHLWEKARIRKSQGLSAYDPDVKGWAIAPSPPKSPHQENLLHASLDTSTANSTDASSIPTEEGSSSPPSPTHWMSGGGPVAEGVGGAKMLLEDNEAVESSGTLRTRSCALRSH
eukprot:GHVQ01001976.1.p1 GENE.GHVQ01001976.1~~GHVQ01001976.1.p1  ORF type:complete len:651 (+),score=61.50 GHVQ01001976.1:614-2566(+)